MRSSGDRTGATKQKSKNNNWLWFNSDLILAPWLLSVPTLLAKTTKRLPIVCQAAFLETELPNQCLWKNKNCAQTACTPNCYICIMKFSGLKKYWWNRTVVPPELSKSSPSSLQHWSTDSDYYEQHPSEQTSSSPTWKWIFLQRKASHPPSLLIY